MISSAGVIGASDLDTGEGAQFYTHVLNQVTGSRRIRAWFIEVDSLIKAPDGPISDGDIGAFVSENPNALCCSTCVYTTQCPTIQINGDIMNLDLDSTLPFGTEVTGEAVQTLALDLKWQGSNRCTAYGLCIGRRGCQKQRQ